jgi:hypothetical protein
MDQSFRFGKLPDYWCYRKSYFQVVDTVEADVIMDIVVVIVTTIVLMENK